ncbi:MAG TPA: hypothetical protein VGF67_07340 [Ktedonobacteraceae bacterium]|jgi:hypothetical protein
MRIEASTPGSKRHPQNSRELSLWSQQASDSRKGLLEWWYGIAAPDEPENSTPQDREVARAGRLSSIILLITLGFGLVQLPNALNSPNHLFLLILLVAMAINIGALLFNRRGKVRVVGAVMVVVVETAFILVVVTSPTGLSSRSLTTFYSMVLTELIAVSLLPPRSVFLVALCNGFFTWVAISFLPHTADLKIATPASYYGALAGPLIMQLIVALVTYLWVEGAREAIARAEEVAALERALAERDRAEAEQKQQLEQGIQQILQTHIQVANGNFEARAPLARENILWQVAYGLNNLLARMQRATQSEHELQRTGVEAARLTEAVRTAKAKRYPVQVQKSGTLLDPLAQELAGNHIAQR